jgi:hypothetical protein
MHANTQRRRNRIHSLEHEGQVELNEDRKVEIVFSFFGEIFGMPSSHSNTIDLGALELQRLDLAGLGERFTEAEVLNVIRSLLPDKAPVPTGSPLVFSRWLGAVSGMTS